MARERSPDSVKAEKLYLRGVKLSEISARLGIASNTVSNWKKRYAWDEETHKKNSQERKKLTTKTHNSKNSQKTKGKCGAKPGNTNSVGHASSTPIGNRRAVRHGAFSDPHIKLFDEDEKRLIEVITDDEEILLLQQIHLYTIRENRILNAINAYMRSPDSLYVDGTVKITKGADDPDVSQYDENIQEKIASGELLTGETHSVSERKENKSNMIARLEKELSTVMKAKDNAIVALNRVRNEKVRLAYEADLHPYNIELMDARIEQLDANTQRMLGENIELEDTSAADELLYGTGAGGVEVETETPTA